MTKKLQIFKPGTHTAMSGKSIEFGESDLLATVNAYDPAKHEAPLVIGHPTVDAPAYGWVKSLDYADSILNAEPDQVDADFAEMVKTGRFKKMSASFFLPDAANNPVPGVYYLRHVGFLGATPPAVKGLKSASFASSEEGVIEFGDWTDQVEAGLFRKLREWIIGKFGQDEADKALPGWDVDAVQNEAARPDPAESSPALYAENNKQEVTMNTAALDAQKADLDAKAVDFAARETVLKTKEAAGRHSEHVAFCEEQIKAGRMLPALKVQAVAMLDFAAGLEKENVVEFGEGDGKKSVPLAESFKTFLSAQPKIVEFSEHAKTETENDTSVNFAAAPGYAVDAAGLERHNKALAYQAKNPGVSYMVAVNAVQ